MITLAHRLVVLDDPSVVLPVVTAFLGPEQPSEYAAYVDFASVILFGDQVPDQFALRTGPRLGAERKLRRAVKDTLTFASISR